MNRHADSRGSVVVVALGIVVILAAAAFTGAYLRSRSAVMANTSGNGGSRSVIMLVKYSGGLCADGNVCSSEYKLYDDGTFQGHTKLYPQELAKLKDTIKATDFLKYQKNPHPNCPSYSDGSDEILVFPQKYPDKSFTLCDLQIPKDDPAINYINALIEAHQERLRQL